MTRHDADAYEPPVSAADVLDADELDAHYRAEAAGRVARRCAPVRPFEELEVESDVEREYRRIRANGGVWRDVSERYDAPIAVGIWALSLATWVVVPAAIVWGMS